MHLPKYSFHLSMNAHWNIFECNTAKCINLALSCAIWVFHDWILSNNLIQPSISHNDYFFTVFFLVTFWIQFISNIFIELPANVQSLTMNLVLRGSIHPQLCTPLKGLNRKARQRKQEDWLIVSEETWQEPVWLGLNLKEQNIKNNTVTQNPSKFSVFTYVSHVAFSPFKWLK